MTQYIYRAFAYLVVFPALDKTTNNKGKNLRIETIRNIADISLKKKLICCYFPFLFHKTTD